MLKFSVFIHLWGNEMTNNTRFMIGSRYYCHPNFHSISLLCFNRESYNQGLGVYTIILALEFQSNVELKEEHYEKCTISCQPIAFTFKKSAI